MIDSLQIRRKGQPVIPCKAPTETSLPSVTRDLTPDSSQNDEDLQADCASSIDGLIEYFNDWDKGRCRRYRVQVTYAEHHRHAKHPSRDEANAYCAHDCNRNVSLRVTDLFGKMGGTVDGGERPAGIDQADEKGHWIRLPASVVDEFGKDKFGWLKRVGTCRHGDRDD